MSALLAALRTLAHLSAWNALYAGALVLAACQTINLPHAPLALLGACALALGVFLLDRVKPADALLDPADQAANPERFAFHRRHARTLRAAIVCALAAGGTLMILDDRPIAASFALLAPAGVLLYGTVRPARGPRLKDRPVRKNLAVALAMACFALAIALGPSLRLAPRSLLVRAPAELLVFAWIALVVFADAALCDLDDAPTDARFGTRTFANTLPAPTLWAGALLVQFLAIPLLVLAHRSAGSPLAPALWWALAVPLSTLAIHLANPPRVRDLIDARFALLALVALAIEHLAR